MTAVLPIEGLYCSGCDQVKPANIQNFYADKSSGTGFTARCRACFSNAGKARRAARRLARAGV